MHHVIRNEKGLKPMKKTVFGSALVFLALLAAGVANADKIGVLLQDSDGSSGGYAHSLKLSTGDWSVTGGVATLPTYSDNETIESLIQQSHADDNATGADP